MASNARGTAGTPERAVAARNREPGPAQAQIAGEFEARRQTVAAGLPGRKLDALLVSFSPNLRYLSGFTGSNGSLLLLPGKSILFTDPRYQIQVAQETTCQVKISRGALTVDVLAAIRRLGLKRIGYEPARMTCDFFESLKSRLPMRASLMPVAGWVEELRMVKSADEIARIRRSVETNSQAFEQAVARVRTGMK
ncbi:MAG: aminopeptidase P family N-terminal domain-containing protein, partial [Acidobacteriia bacterium]|nr:aminopeptidase P family N-terminal domain-containing protein [Terriglobia bacterium]